jgi:hypothetical protein
MNDRTVAIVVAMDTIANDKEWKKRRESDKLNGEKLWKSRKWTTRNE